MPNIKTIGKRIVPTSNPIVVKELRSRMRGPRAFIILTAALLILAAISYALYQLVLVTSAWSYSPLSPQIGQTLFTSLALIEMLMICLITPAITAGTISAEHENLTYEMLLTTPLKPTRILWGKLVSALSYIFLLIFAAIPMASLVFIYGGVSLRDMLKALVVLICTAIMLGTIGIFTSTWLKRTARATVISYLVVLFMVGAPTFIYGIVALFRGSEPPRWLLVPSPVSALFSAIAPSITLGSSSLSMIGGFSMLMAGNFGFFSTNSIPRPLYHYTLPLYGAITIGLYFLAARLVRPARRWRIRAKELFGTVIVFAIFGGIVALAFMRTTDRYENISIFAVPTPFAPMEPMIEPAVVQSVEPALPVAEDEAITAYSSALQSIQDSGILVGIERIAISKQTYFEPSSPELSDSMDELVFPDNLIESITFTQDENPAEIIWTDNFDTYQTEISSKEPGTEEALLLFSNLNPLKTGMLQLMGAIYFFDQSHQGMTINLTDQNGSWEVISFQFQEVQSGSSEPINNDMGELSLSTQEYAEIYSNVILQVYTVDSPMPGFEPKQMYIVQNTVLSAEPSELPAPIRTNIESELASLPFSIVWIENRTEAPFDEAGAIEADGGLIEFGDIQLREDGRLELIVNLHYSETGKTLVTYILENVPDGGWQIVELGGHG